MDTRSRLAAGPDGAAPPGPRDGSAAVRSLPRSVRRGRILGGLLVVVVAATATGWLFVSAGERVSVLMVRRDVPVGRVLTAQDVTSTRVAADSAVRTVPASQVRTVTGRVAATDLRAGSLLAPSQLTASLSPGPGQQIVPVGLKANQLPAGDLNPGDQVLVVPTPGAAGQAATGQPASGQAAGRPDAAPLTKETPATIDRVSAISPDGTVVVNLLVAAGTGSAIAKQASTGQIALLVTARKP